MQHKFIIANTSEVLSDTVLYGYMLVEKEIFVEIFIYQIKK